MATTQKIEIPVSLSAQIENLREIRQTLTATLNSAGKDSSLAKTLTKDLSKINQMLGEVEEFALSPTIDESGLKQLQKVLDNFYKQAQSSFSNADFANFEAIASESDIARLKTLTAEAAKYRRELETLRKSGSSERTDAYLLRAGKQDLLGKAQAQKGFDSTASLGKNALAMERAAESYQRSADAMQTAIEKLESEANAAIANAQQAAQQVKTLEQQKQTLGADTQAARFHHAAGRFKTAIVANRGVENPTISSVERGLRSALESVQANGKIATDARNAVGDWIKHLFPQLPTSDIASMVGQDINTLLSDLMERIFGSGYLDTDVIYSPEHSAILSRAQDYSRSEINRIAGIHSTANVLDLTARSQQVDSDWRKAKSRWTAYNNEADSKVTSWLEMTDQQEELTAAAQAAAQLSQELYTLADAAQKAAIASKEAQIQQNAEAQQDLKEGATRPTRQLAQQGKTASRQYQADDASFLGEVNENLKGAKIDANEAEQFTNDLKQSITHWMSAQQIINLVKDGIRQAYQDIKSLDAAMTNIAVVTDMSVSDLWGKINEYMSIAQQYGVTTQGVYEVSQLYYQQGLSTNEVMAATTETLKMARIAGMGYAEAADAMTVAIRSFKMEMSDAGHVTDVYSKVAAITASDSEELAIAMSKTASSAESVGSSFENTTAMLAVMVETTRESAQNLGSALKSIISRYGEMKSGMTQDSDGEIIDYNKTDAALRSIGISLKDAQGQFRDFDDVIFELSAKWDSLDKNTQRYIATIMAGNRQQSRFIALVDNWERLEEVTGAAQDSEDAGLLQYAKTLDSLDTKLNNLKTSFQSFYMSIFNGEFFKGFIDIITNVVDNLSKVGPLLGSINLLQLINQIKLVGQLLLNAFSKNIGKIQQSSKEWQKSFTNGWPSVGERIADVIAKAIVAKAVPTGKQFAEGVVQGAQGGQGQPQNVVPQKNQAQTIKIKDKYREQAQNYFKQIGLDFSVGNLFDKNGKLTKNAAREFLSPKKNSKVSNFDNLTQSYQKQADAILKASDQFDKTAVDWANKVKAAGNGFEAKMGAAGKQAYLTALKTADAEAEIELAAAKQAAAEQKKAATQQKWGQGLTMIGTALSSTGMMVDQSTMAGYDTSTGLQAGGAALSALGQGLTGNYVGAAITAITGIVTVIQRVSQRAKVELENAKKAAEEANIERAGKKESYQSLVNYTKKLKELEQARFDSTEAEEEWLALNNEIAEKYPELISYIDSEGNAIVNLTDQYEGLAAAKQQALTADRDYWRKQLDYYTKNNIYNYGERGKTISQDTAEALYKQAYATASGADRGLFDQYHTAAVTGLNTYTIAGSKKETQQTVAKQVFNRWSTGEIFTLSQNQADAIIAMNDPSLLKAAFGGLGYNENEILTAYNAQAPKESQAASIDKIPTKALVEIFKIVYNKPKLATPKVQDAANTKINKTGLPTSAEDYAQLTGLTIESFLKSGINVQQLLNDANSKSASAGLSRQLLLSYGLIGDTPDESGVYTFTEKGLAARDFSKNELLIDNTIKNYAASEGNLLLYGTTAAETLSQIEGFEEILLNRAIALAGGVDQLQAFIEDSDKLSSVYVDYADSLAKWYETLTLTEQELLQQMMADSGSFTQEEMLKNLTNMGASKETTEAIRQSWYADNYTAKYRGMQAIWGNDEGVLKNLLSFEDWKKSDQYVLKEGQTEQEAYYEYTTKILNELKGVDAELKSILQTASLAQQEQFISWWKTQKEIIEQSEGYAKTVAQDRLDQIEVASKALLDKNADKIDFGNDNIIDISELDSEERATLFNLITSSDIGTSEGVDAVINFLESKGITVNDNLRAILEEWIYENVNTRVNLLIEQVDSISKELSDIAAKHEKGFSFSESQALLQNLRKLNPALAWNDVFKVNEEGLIVLLNFDKTLEDSYKAQIAKYGEESKYLTDTVLSKLNKKDDTVTDELIKQIQDENEKISTAAEATLRKNLEDAGWEKSDIDTVIAQIKSGELNSEEAIYNYFMSLASTLEGGTDYIIAEWQKSLSDVAYRNITKEYTKALQAKDTTSASNINDLRSMWDSQVKKGETSINGHVYGVNEDGTPTWTAKDWEDYYTVQYKALETHGASLDAFGNLIITDWEKWGTYIAESYGFIENGVIKNQDAYDAVMAESKAAQLKATEDYANSVKDGFASIAESLAEDGKIEFSELEGILAALQSQGLINGTQYKSIIDAYIEAKDKGPEAIKEVLQKIANYTYGTDVDLTGINEAYKDAVLSIAKSVFDNISSALKGTINATDLSNLSEQLGLPNLADFGLQTIDGFQLNAEGLLLVLDGVQKKYGSIYGTAEKMVEMLVGDGKMYSGYQDIEAAAKDLLDTHGNIKAGYEEEYELLKQMAAVARGMADDARFDFMNQDQTSGMGDTWDTFVGSIGKVKSALKSLTEEGSISVRDFQNMMTFTGRELGAEEALKTLGYTAETAAAKMATLYNSDKNVRDYLASLGYDSAKAVEELTDASEVYKLFVNTIVASSGELDSIDADVLLKFGVETKEMSKSMKESLAKVAEDQIDFLKGIREMLVAMKGLEGIGDIEIGITIRRKDEHGNVLDGPLTLSDVVDLDSGRQKKVDENGVEVELTKEDKEGLTTGTNTALKTRLGADNPLYKNLFGADGFVWDNESDIASLTGIVDFEKRVGKLTSEQWQSVAKGMAAAVKGIKDPEEYRRAVLDYMAKFNPNSIEGIDILQSSSIQAALTLAGIKFDVDAETQTVTLKEGADPEKAKQAIIDYYQTSLGQTVEVVLDGQKVSVVVVNPQVKAEVDKSKAQGDEVTFDATTGYTIKTTVADESFTYRIDPKNGTITDKDGNPFKPEDVPEALREKWLSEGYEEVPTEIEGGETTVSYKINTEAEGESNPLAAIQATLDLIYGMFSSGQVLSLSFDNTSAETTQTVLDAILAAWDTLIKLDGSTVTLNVNQGGNAGPQTPAGAEDTNQAESGVAVPLTIDKANFISQLTTLYTSITNNTDGVEPPVIKVIAEWQEGSPANLEAAIKAQTFVQDVQLNYTNKDGYKQTGLVQNVRLNYIHGGVGVQAKGNVALAYGNVQHFLAGAALAQGTLMGELGPELYVQGGQYYIAGANGPEFVDLHNDAIVFNHLQTASLLGKGHATTTGSPVTSERRAVGAYATGNVSGPAMAGGIDSAIAAINSAIAMWQNILNATAVDLLGGGGGGGGGGENSVKAVTEELVKWYNLSRQIKKLEQDINNLLAERKNITDGGEYLRSLREQQQLLAQQAATQQTLLAYQEEQLGRQQEHIKNNKIWSQFLTFDESGNLQYITGNESNGGQGQLSVLEQLNKMSGEEQLNYIKNTLGYSYTDQDGKTLDGQDLVTQFFKELQEQIDSYDSLYDTVHSTEEQLQKIQTSISEIDAEIEKNQMDLEKAIYDIILDSWKKQIEQMEDQKKLAQEANEAYIENLNKALSDEREMYSQNESIADRESLQNRLALLRRSGGSASEIYDLEQQLDSMLKDEYFNKQEKMIENIEEASKEQIKKLEEQIKLEEEALEYQKENGVLWTQVYEIMQGTEESILAFMQGKAPEFFSQSTLQQKQMLTDWAKQIGIYTEDQQYKNYRKEAEDTHWDKNSWRAKISEGGVGRELAAIFDGLNADQQGTLKNLFTSTYANKMLESGDEKEALKAAIAALKAQLKSIKSQQASAAAAASGGSGGNGSGGTGQNPSSGQKPKRYRVDYTVVFVDNQIKTGYGVGSSEYEALAAAKYQAKKHTKSPPDPKNNMYPGGAPVRNTNYSKAYAYKQGGLVDYTGPALVHGTPSKPEAFLNAKQTAMISEAVKTAGDGGALNGIKATLAALNSTIKGIVNNDNSLTSSFTVAPGAVTIQVAQLNDSYDVEELSKDVMNRMVAIASRATNRGVNRR